MVNTRSETNRVPRDDRNARDEGNSNDPQFTHLNERMEHMAKSIEDLATMNAVLQAQVPELHRTVTDPGNREEGSRVEGSGEPKKEEEVPGNPPPTQPEAARAVQGMIARLEQRCNVLTAAIQ
jgi:hypothetical protein